MSEPVSPDNNAEPATEWVKQRISDEEITNLQQRLENSVKMLHQKDIIIRKLAELLEAYGINMIVLARNSQTVIDQSTG